jgi:hypothetical protein
MGPWASSIVTLSNRRPFETNLAQSLEGDLGPKALVHQAEALIQNG